MTSLSVETDLIEASSPEEVPVDKLREVMAKNTFACIRGIVAEQEMLEALDKIKARFDPANDHAVAGNKPDSVRDNFQKMSVGGESRTASNDDARLFRAFYNPIWSEDIYGMRSAFIRLAQVRNRIADLPPDFALDKIEPNGLWTAARFHQYPAGGGFFRRHTDYVVKDIADKGKVDFFQVVLTMTRKGEHFHQGGAFVDVGDDRICLDDGALPGDLIIYDGGTQHGVEDIDPTEILDLQTMNGRVAGFATLFKKM